MHFLPWPVPISLSLEGLTALRPVGELSTTNLILVHEKRAAPDQPSVEATSGPVWPMSLCPASSASAQAAVRPQSTASPHPGHADQALPGPEVWGRLRLTHAHILQGDPPSQILSNPDHLALTRWFYRGPNSQNQFLTKSFVTSAYGLCSRSPLGCTLKSSEVFLKILIPGPQPPASHLIGAECGLAIGIFKSSPGGSNEQPRMGMGVLAQCFSKSVVLVPGPGCS